ncbi:putative zinc-binding peptidase [Rhabdobacter roseus]|uniref:Zinc-ribbon domain-containing protein n=1 Tax=Rhabdobacter roseus TaxID=1655419 RepID=A0A840TM88_9BACT|nr:putative zinc-binding peptidase [Rhabdobacter roseus]MBB5282867.1 hypothetical protein [Rhabdobacter roseus]
MKLHTCSYCQNPLYFENSVCLNCQNSIGFNPDSLAFVTLTKQPKGTWANILNPQETYRYCHNADYGACNWLVPSHHPTVFCRACELNRTIPQLSKKKNLKNWRRIEVAKRRLVYSLLRLKLPLVSKHHDPDHGLAFDFLADVDPNQRVMTGHANGLITLNIEEANEYKRVRNKLNLGEKYRTLLGHFRHEVGHYYWDVLLKEGPALEAYRQLFGDERADYGEALQKYYQDGAPPNWAERFISPYATAHSWEDWAETWAHYLHLMDTLETAFTFGIHVGPQEIEASAEMKAAIKKDPYTVLDFERIVRMWLPLTFAVNSLNRSMGHPDFYPFIITPAIIQKLRFIHELCLTHAVRTPLPDPLSSATGMAV